MWKSKGMGLFSLSMALMFVLGLGGKAMAQEEYQQEYQQEGQQQEMMQQEAPEVDLSDAELDKIAEAYEAVTEVREEFQGELEGMEDPEQAQEVQAEAEEKMVQAVEETGLEVETYNQAMEAAQMDEELRNDLLERLDLEEEY